MLDEKALTLFLTLNTNAIVDVGTSTCECTLKPMEYFCLDTDFWPTFRALSVPKQVLGHMSLRNAQCITGIPKRRLHYTSINMHS